MPEIGGGCGGAAAAVQKMKSEMDAEILNLIPHGRMLEAELRLIFSSLLYTVYFFFLNLAINIINVL